MTKPVDDQTKTSLKIYRWIIMLLAVLFTVAAFLVVPELFLARAKAKPDVEIGVIAIILVYMSLGNWCIWIITRRFFTMSQIQKRIYRLNLLFLSVFLFTFTLVASTSDDPMGLGVHGSIIAPFMLILTLFYFIFWITMVRGKRRKSMG